MVKLTYFAIGYIDVGSKKLEQYILYNSIQNSKRKRNDDFFAPLKIVSWSTKKYKLWVRGEDNNIMDFETTDIL